MQVLSFLSGYSWGFIWFGSKVLCIQILFHTRFTYLMGLLTACINISEKIFFCICLFESCSCTAEKTEGHVQGKATGKYERNYVWWKGSFSKSWSEDASCVLWDSDAPPYLLDVSELKLDHWRNLISQGLFHLLILIAGEECCIYAQHSSCILKYARESSVNQK